jgi:hypothetical protein
MPIILGHRLMGVSLMRTGDIAEGRAHFDLGIAHYARAAQRPLATLVGKREPEIVRVRAWPSPLNAA